MKTIEIERNTLRHGDVKPIQVIVSESQDGTSWSRIVIFSRKVIESKCGVRAPKVITRRDPNPCWNGMSFPDWDAMSEEDIARISAVSEAACEASGCYAFESGPGRPFASEATARLYTRFVVVRQGGGLDV